MVEKKKKKIVALFAVLLATASVIGATLIEKTAKAAVNWSDIAFENVYEYGSRVSIPARTVMVDGKAVETVAVVKYPDGTTSKADEILLNVGGKYSVTYSAIVGMKSYEKTETFFVESNILTMNDERSSFSYGSYTYDRLLADGSYMAGEKTYTCEPGIMVRLAEGDTVTFTQPVDLRGVTMDDVLLSAFATPDVQGVSDFERIIFTFTDVADPNVYLSVSATHTTRGAIYPNSYYLAGANGQLLSGINQSGELQVANKSGTMRGHSFTRRYEEYETYSINEIYHEQDKDVLSFSLDTESKKVYATKRLVVDLDDPAYFDNLWTGFVSGFARLSITADFYNGTTANFCVTQIRGLNLSMEKYVDTEAPVITVNDAHEVLPNACVGHSYPVPTATAYDLDSGERRVKVNVWYNYSSANATLIQVKDGYFRTDKVGEYTIVYKATDASGNEAVEMIWVTAKESVPEMDLSLSDDRKTQAVCGEYVPVATFAVENYVGDEADLQISITAVCGNVRIDAMDGFRPSKEGEYTIVYEVRDYIQRIVRQEYKISVTRGSAPIFEAEAELPFAFVSGAEYVLPDLEISDYTSGKLQKRLVAARVSDSTGTKTVQPGETFTPVVKENEEIVTVTYFEGNVEKSYRIPTVLAWVKNPSNNRNELQLKNFFFSDGVLYEQEANSAKIVAGEEDASWTFARSLIADGLNVEFASIVGRSQYGGLSLVLCDEQNTTQKVSLQLKRERTGTVIGVGEIFAVSPKSLQNGESFSIVYENAEFRVDGMILNVVNYDSGLPFAGFSSGKVIVSMYFIDATIGAAYNLITLDTQGITSATADRFAPRIRILGTYGGVKQLGTEVVLPAAVSVDVLDPNLQFCVTVKNPDLSVAKDVNGLLLDKVDPTVEYTLRLTNYGQYLVEYYAADSAPRPNENPYSYAINALDEIAPTVEILSKVPTTAKVGDTLIFPEVSIKDDYSAKDKIIVRKVIVTPSGTVYSITDSSNAIVCAQVGMYSFKVYAVDEYGNVTVDERIVMVTE